MARKKSIKYQLKERLGSMAAYGTSKHEQREISKKTGIDLTKNQIYSYSTMTTYQSQISRYATWLDSKGLGKCSIEEAASFVQEYLDHQVSRGLSAFSIHTTCAALSKVFRGAL